MERDFLGLNSKDGCSEHGFTGSAGMQWAFSNKVSVLPKFLSYKPTQEEWQKNMRIDPLASSGFQHYETFDSVHKPSSTLVTQKTFNLDRRTAHLTMQGCPVTAMGSNEMRTFPVSNHSIPVAMSNSFGKIQVVKQQQQQQQQPLGGIPVTHSIIPIMESMARTYAPRNISKSVPTSGQLTIFYGGVVNVYDEVPPEKAQAIMFLVGNGSSMTANAANPRTQPLAMIPKPVVADVVLVNQSPSTSPRSSLSSPTSVTSHTGTQSRSGSSNIDDSITAKALETGLPPKMVIESAAGTLTPAAVPQARKASLARFLENRKERMMNSSPYANSQDSTFRLEGGGFASKSLTTAVAQSWCLGAS